MDTDELELPGQKSTPPNLEIMSVEALCEYIEQLEMEIVRVRAQITAKKIAREGAEDVFKK